MILVVAHVMIRSLTESHREHSMLSDETVSVTSSPKTVTALNQMMAINHLYRSIFIDIKDIIHPIASSHSIHFGLGKIQQAGIQA